MSRRKRQSESSLELLLDTICNTFGGVLFLSILIVVLLQMSGRSNSSTTAPDVSSADLAALEQRHTEVSSALESLQAAAAEQRALADQFAKPENVRLLNDLRSLEDRRDSLRSRRSASVSHIGQLQQRIEGTNADLRGLDAKLADLHLRVENAERSLKDEIAKRTTAAQLPRQHATVKREVGILVRYGRLYLWHRYDGQGNRMGVNTDDMVVVKDHGSYLETTPKPFAGVPLDIATDQGNQIRLKLSIFDPRTVYVAVVIWDDSFEQFQSLKKVLIERGFEYRLMPISEGESVRDHGGTGRNVQ